MTKRSRYLILALGLVTFVILAPLIVLYVRGISYDFTTKKFIATGILAVNVDPSDSQVSLNGKVYKNGSGDIRFLPPDEYQVSLSKPGYLSWTKRLDINPGQVTWASPSYNNIYLFYNKPTIKDYSANVADFYSDNNFLAFLNPDGFTVTSLNNPEVLKTYPLTKPVNKIAANDDNNTNFIFTSDSTGTSGTILELNLNNGKTADLTALFSGLPVFTFEGGRLFALSQNTLYYVDVAAKTKKPLVNNIKAASFQNGTLYFINQNPDGSQSLMAASYPFSDPQTLKSNLPAFADEQLFVTYGKQVLLLADGSLFKLNSSLDKLADNVRSYDFDIQNSVLSFQQSGEFDYYSGGAVNFVTRSGDQLNNLTLRNNIDYAFFIKNSQLMAIELDTRDSQNQYSLYQGTDLKKFVIDSGGRNVIALDGGALKKLVIR